MKLSLYDKISLRCSRAITTGYSTSFTLGIKTLAPRHRNGIYAIYGFVRLADEIVDTFFDQRQRKMLDRFRVDTENAVASRVSANPVLHSFQWAVNTYGIDRGRVYFPGIDFSRFSVADKKLIEENIADEFREALTGIRVLDRGSRRGVYLAYSYYIALFSKIRNTPPEAVTGKRFRISEGRKLLLLVKAVVWDITGMI